MAIIISNSVNVAVGEGSGVGVKVALAVGVAVEVAVDVSVDVGERVNVTFAVGLGRVPNNDSSSTRLNCGTNREPTKKRLAMNAPIPKP